MMMVMMMVNKKIIAGLLLSFNMCMAVPGGDRVTRGDEGGAKVLAVGAVGVAAAVVYCCVALYLDSKRLPVWSIKPLIK